MKSYKIAVLPGDGIGVEIVPEAIKVMEAVGAKLGYSFEYEEGLIGGAAIDETGDPLPADTIALCKNSDAVLLGAVGGAKWDSLPVPKRPEIGALLPLRKELGLFANIRPAFVYDELADASTLKKEVVSGTDLVTFRELTGGIYFGKKTRGEDEKGAYALDEDKYYVSEIERIARLAFEAARKRRNKVTSVDKANVLESSRLWRETVVALHEREYKDVELDHLYVDNAAMQLVLRPSSFDIILTENMFGDILTDLASVMTGSIGMLASASVGGDVAMYEPSHGSAPDIAGQGKANPLATILSASMMFQYSFDDREAAVLIENAIKKVLADGYRTPDIIEEGKTLVSTSEMGDLVVKAL
ncbi:MAG: 3-isopropylmalate dehydrogenase [Tissierellia bacterium]|nr:3-isopropylmalate dehydrogenase [Tissierellia bacterium]